MTEQEKINSEVQTKLALQDAKFEIAMDELKQQREDIRRINDRIDSKFDSLSNQIRTLTIAAVISFEILALGALIIGALK